MKKLSCIVALMAAIALLPVSCTTPTSDQSNPDGKEEAKAPLVADSALNRAARFYAGMSKDGIEMNATDAAAWDEYSKTIRDLLDQSEKTTSQMDSLATKDFADFRDSIDYVFYPLSAADFLYPITLYPNADTYFLCGLEHTGSPFGSKVNTTYAHYAAYRTALQTFLGRSFFITKDMKNDFQTKELDGVYSVIAMLMAVKGYEIISIDYRTVDANGKLVPADTTGNILEYKFFKSGSTHEQTLIYYSGNCFDEAFEPGLKKYLDTTLAQHKVGTYLKAASFFMCEEYMSMMRSIIVDNSYTVVEDDSGIPYRFFTEKYNVTLYGSYVHPAPVFGKNAHQPDLQEIYARDKDKIRPLPFRIGYNVNSNWLVARRK